MAGARWRPGGLPSPGSETLSRRWRWLFRAAAGASTLISSSSKVLVSRGVLELFRLDSFEEVKH
eukprot:272327-Pyramimonas_sp.AAC.1